MNPEPLTPEQYYLMCMLTFAVMLGVIAVWYLFVTRPIKDRSAPFDELDHTKSGKLHKWPGKPL